MAGQADLSTQVSPLVRSILNAILHCRYIVEECHLDEG